MSRDTDMKTTGQPAGVAPRRLLYVVRLAYGGAAAGFFLGVCLGSVVELTATAFEAGSLLGLSGILLSGLALSLIGGIWGSILALTDA